MSERHRGRIKWFNRQKGFGLIQTDSIEDDIFLHESKVPDHLLSHLQEGDRVSFVAHPTNRRPEARDAWFPGRIPLFSQRGAALLRNENAHCGLLFDKFCNQWEQHRNVDPKKWQGLGDHGKWEWLSEFDGRAVGNSALITEHLRRRRQLIDARDGQRLTVQSTSRFVTGLGLAHPVENGFRWHHTLGVPCLPGSSVKGMMRHWVIDWRGEEEDALRLFGNNEDEQMGAGDLLFFDALPTEPPRLTVDVMTPHYGPWYQKGPQGDEVPADWHSPPPIPFLVVEAGAEFEFALAPRPGREVKLDQAAAWLKEALQQIGAGAKTAVGYGRFTEASCG